MLNTCLFDLLQLTAQIKKRKEKVKVNLKKTEGEFKAVGCKPPSVCVPDLQGRGEGVQL